MHLTRVAAAVGVCCSLLAACATPKSESASATAKPESTPATAKPEQVAHNSGDQLICRSVEVTGSRMPTRECHTSSEWARLKSEGEDQLGVEAQRSLATPGGN